MNAVSVKPLSPSLGAEVACGDVRTLHALEIPPKGGNTGFANMYLALQTQGHNSHPRATVSA